jgi:hypothetical protein
MGFAVRRALWLGVALGLILPLCGCICVVCYEEDHLGRVIDAETREPLEGVVVLGYWYRIIHGPGGGHQKYYDAEETVTDNKGEFRIKGMGLKVFSNVDEMFVLVFKAGCEGLSGIPWSTLREGMILSKKITWERKRAIIPIRKMTDEEKSRAITPGGAEKVPKEKMKKLIEEWEKHSSDLLQLRRKR